jgi:nitroreductase
MIRELIEKNRSYRKFHEEAEVTQETLRELVDLARLSGCGMNMQSLRYMLTPPAPARQTAPRPATIAP